MHVMGSVSPANERQVFSPQEEDVALAVVVPTSPLSTPLRFSDIEGDRTKPPPPALAPHPPPPPPLLPPPPPPPPPPSSPPPLLPGLGDPAGEGLRKKKKVRSFFWKTIPEEQVKGRANLWTQGQVQQEYQIDVQTIEELFGQNDCQSNAKGPPTRGGRIRSSFRETKEEVSILDSKRGMNVGIFLKQFKRSNRTIVDDIRHGNSEPYGAEPLRELLKLLPDTEEVTKLKSYRGDVAKLSLADSFMYLLIQLPSYSVRIESMLLKEEFPRACEAMKRDIRILRSATKELMCCEELHAVLHLVLQAGNILNAGGYAGNAVGFKLSSLLSLADTKANKPGMNLLHFVALEAQKKDERLLEFPLKLSHVQAAARISLEMLDAELQWLISRTRSVEESFQRDTELLQQLDSFLQSATSSLCSLRGGRQQLKKEGSELIDFFCEDRETFRLDDCFGIFHTFCSRFTDAVKENMEREAKEAARRQRLQELEEQKRHSWAGGEEVGGGFRLRCSSETDMSTAMSRHDEAGLLTELLTSKSSPRSPLNNSNCLLGRSGSLRRTRYSPSSSPSIAAERELSMLLEMATPDRKVTLQRGGGEARTAFRSASPKPGVRSPGLSPQSLPQSPRITTYSFPQNQQPQEVKMASQTPLSPPETSWSPKSTNAHHTTATYLSDVALQTPVDAINPISKVTLKPTSDSNQQSDHNNNGKDRLDLGFSSQAMLSHHQTQPGLKGAPTGVNKADADFSGQITCSDQRFEYSTTDNMSVVVETCTLVPELKVFDKVTTLISCNEGHHTSRLLGHHQDNMVITDLEEGGMDKSQIQEVQNKSRTGNAEKCDVQISETSSSSPRRDEQEVQEEKVVVWCVTGVCEVAGEFTHADNTHVQTEKDRCRIDNQGGNQQTSSAPASHTPSEPQPANEKPVPVPISSQPVPVPRCDDPSLQVSSPRWHPAEPTSTYEAPALTADASEEVKEPANQGEEAEGSPNETREVETLPEQSTDDKGRNNTASCHTTNENTEAAFTNEKAEPATSSKPSTKNAPTSKIRPAGVKANVTPNTTSNTNKSKPVRTLTNSENQGMRRVVPISRTTRGAPTLGNRPEKPPGHHRRSSSITALTSPTVSNFNSNSLRRGERPSTAPSSRQSSVHKTQDPNDSKDQKVSGTQASAREQNQDLQRKPSIRKPFTKPKPQQEEKICRSTLRALTQAGERGEGGGSISAPATPLHKASTPSSSPLPGFARSTASSSFRWTHTTLVPPGPPHSPHTGSDSSHKSSPKPTSSSPFTRIGSLRVSTASRSSDLLNMSSSSPLRRSQSIRASPHSPVHDSLTPPKGHRQNDSGNFSDKSTHSRDSVKAIRPSWR
ncbi:LOW QUALITY PROTEIN: FH2 domain-containing protein 1-like [Xiphias gladius]|uniref:LOW QUALITY PROTEIN: FH2 domain-containing protein 1-like n=1 Tax=Xiphias gladius TaxID=8245 RepID=UPI001A999569|nr:LOW QUALITY PROTEIN: FH2 domain-containing protein 1-like [Xiphias gladius]